MRTLLLCVAVLLLSGCATIQKLPPISADSIDYKRTDPLGGTAITASGVKKAPDGSITAESVTWDTTYPQFSIKLSVKGYKQDAK